MIGAPMTHSRWPCRPSASSGGERTWSVLDGDHGVAEPTAQLLRFLWMFCASPNTDNYDARAPSSWW
jgi:hypothetical protein